MVGTEAQRPGAAVGMGTLSPCSTGPFSHWFPEACVRTETPEALCTGASLTVKHRAFPMAWCFLQCKFRKPWAQRCSRHKSPGQGLALSMRDSLRAIPAGALEGPRSAILHRPPLLTTAFLCPSVLERHCPHQNLRPTDPFLSMALPFWFPVRPVSTLCVHAPFSSCFLLVFPLSFPGHCSRPHVAGGLVTYSLSVGDPAPPGRRATLWALTHPRELCQPLSTAVISIPDLKS